jgi:hypothetical protein
MAARAAAIVLLVLLHGLLFFAFNPTFSIKVGQPANELVLLLPRPSPQRPQPPVITPALEVPQIPFVAPPFAPQSTGPVAAPSASVTGVGHALFDCDLANSRNLPPDQRSGCLHLPLAQAAPEIGMPKRSHAMHSALWAAELAAKKAPAEVPCAHVERETIGGFAAQRQTTTIMADPLCLLGRLFGSSPTK